MLRSSAPGCSDTLAIRWIGTWCGESAYEQPLDRGHAPAAARTPGPAGSRRRCRRAPDPSVCARTPSSSKPTRGQAEFVGAVGGHVHHRRAVAHRAELVRRGERRARVGRLVADRAVVFGGVADRFVDRQPEVRRVDDEVGRSRRHARRLGLLGQQRRQLRPARRTSPTRRRRRRPPSPAPSAAPACASSRTFPPRRRRSTASNVGCTRTRCWVIDEPNVSA